jgi:hypothetical protein
MARVRQAASGPAGWGRAASGAGRAARLLALALGASGGVLATPWRERGVVKGGWGGVGPTGRERGISQGAAAE